jgi:hypothetical protein
MEMQKISLNIEDRFYVMLKQESLQKRITISNILRTLISKKYEVIKDGEKSGNI